MYHLGLLVARAVGFWGLETKNWVQSTSSHVSRYCSFIFSIITYDLFMNRWYQVQLCCGKLPATVLWKVACKVMPVDVTLPWSKVHQWDSATRLLLSPSPPISPAFWLKCLTHTCTHTQSPSHACTHMRTPTHILSLLSPNSLHAWHLFCKKGLHARHLSHLLGFLGQHLEMQTLGWGYSATWRQTFRKTGKSSIWLLVCFVFRSTVAVTWGYLPLVKR